MKKTKFYSLIAILLMFVVALTCGFLFACGSNDEDEVTNDGIIEENPTDSTDPTEPTIPSDYIIGTWSNASITVNVSYSYFNLDAAASVELTVSDEDSNAYGLNISNISLTGNYASMVEGILEAIGVNLSEYEIEMEGTWTKNDDGTYTLTGEEGNEVVVTLGEDENGEAYLTMSFSITYVFGEDESAISITIGMTDQVLYAGALEVEVESGDEE